MKMIDKIKKTDKLNKNDKQLQILTTSVQEQFWGTFTKATSKFFTSAHSVQKLLSTNQQCTITFKSCITKKKIDKKLPTFHSSSRPRSSKPPTIYLSQEKVLRNECRAFCVNGKTSFCSNVCSAQNTLKRSTN